MPSRVRARPLGGLPPGIEEANLHPLGRFLIRAHLQSILETRLRIAHYWKDKLELMRALPIEQPVFIVGMPRSGSTFLHELLAEDARNRAPRVWEVMFPIPTSNDSQEDVERRIRKAETCLWWFRRLAPEADSVYPMRAQTPHECVAIQSYTLLSQEFVSTCRIPSYEAFLAAQDLLPAYRWEKCFLQHLQLNRLANRWVLKSPDHVYGLDALFKVFPDAFIIHTHRNPLEVLESSAELTRVLQALFGWRADPAELAAREARVLAIGTHRSMQFRDRHPELAHRFIDLKYPELVRNPLKTVRAIYTRLETPLTDETVLRIQELLSKRSRYRRSRANSSLGKADCEPSSAEIFRRYCMRFNLPLGKGG